MGNWIQSLNNFGIIKVGWKYVWNELGQNGVQTYFILKFWYTMILGPNKLLRPTSASLVLCLMIVYSKILLEYPICKFNKIFKSLFDSQRCCIILS